MLLYFGRDSLQVGSRRMGDSNDVGVGGSTVRKVDGERYDLCQVIVGCQVGR